MKLIIETQRLILRPVTTNDAPEIAKVIFSDPDVVGMLAHNTRDPKDALGAAETWTKVMGVDGNGGIWDDGGLGLFAVAPRFAKDQFAGVAGFYMERNENDRWNGEYFYALGTKWHGQGLMTEAAGAFSEKLKSLPDLGVIYAAYWDMINEASGRLLIKTGLKPKGRVKVTEEYDHKRCQRMFEYDLWRLAETSPGTHQETVAIQVARRAGAFVAEAVVDRNEALAKIGQSLPSGRLSSPALDMFDRAISWPGMAYLEIRGEGEIAMPVNRLG